MKWNDVTLTGFLCLCLLSATAYSFQFPSFESLSKLFYSETVDENPEEVLERVKRQNGGDECTESYLSCSSTLPLDENGEINFRYMPSLANGHLGFVPFRPYIHMRGLYNGAGGQSHRAQIPNIIMGKIEMPNERLERSARRRYIFNAREGTFTEEIESEFAYITHRMYVHQKYTNVFVSDLYLKRKRQIPGGGFITIKYPGDLEFNSPDFIFGEPESRYANSKIRGTVLQSEDGNPANKENVYVFYTRPIESLSIFSDDKNETMIMAFDRTESSAQNDFDKALEYLSDSQRGAYGLLQSHIDEWTRAWEDGSVEVQGNVHISKITTFAQYNIMSNLPALSPDQPRPQDEYHYGVARSGLGHGSLGVNHQGHVMWDSEMYVLPAILVFHPQLAKKMLRYRTKLFEQAKNNAAARGEEGARFPWESAQTGIEVTPDNTCPGCIKRQIHVNGAVAFGIRQYFSLTRDFNFLSDQYYNPCEVMREIARFFVDKAKWNKRDARYSIDDVMGPDDYHDHVDNNAYTNVIASLAIHYARYLACMCQGNERKEVPDDWIQVAVYLDVPFSNKKRLHYPFDGYDSKGNSTIKQSDTLLLGYPLNWNMSRDIMKNDLEFYEDHMDVNTPAMTYSFMSVAWKFAEDRSKMMSSFQKSYQDYLIQPFKVWTEYNENDRETRARSTVNFMPGQGAFIQSVVYGFAGVRVRPEQLEFHNPMPPPDCRIVKLKGFDYMGASMTFTIDKDQHVLIQVHSIGDYELVLQRNRTKGRESLRPGEEIEIQDGQKGFFIFSTRGTSCEHPRDYVYMPWGYSPWISAAPHSTRDVTYNTAILISISLCVHLLCQGHSARIVNVFVT